MPRMTTRGEKSIDEDGRRRRIGRSTGSVTWCRNRTIGFQGSGFTQDRRARITMIHMYAYRT